VNGSPRAGSPPRVWGKRGARRDRDITFRFTPTRVGKTRIIRIVRLRRSVHPHACGENHARGKLVVGRVRFTPTRVGKTLLGLRLSVVEKVHPHACGENGLRRPDPLLDKGSPPRVWGKRHQPQAKDDEHRFTPTRVGKTAPSRSAATPVQVHPHACGENTSGGMRPADSPGSPPRVWGKPKQWHQQCERLRFTPTRVGKTSGKGSRQIKITVHPHACGENRRGRAHTGRLNGSPPRVWGKQKTQKLEGRGIRFTPTRVGKTRRPARILLNRQVHPHACGENPLEFPFT